MKDIKNYEGLYAVTSCGKVWSYKRKKFLNPFSNEKGYLLVTLCKDSVIKHYKVHRLVAEAYIPNPENKPQVNHIDECKTNNCLNNLCWMTGKENVNYGTGKERSAKARRKKVICIETGEIFNSLTETAKVVNKSIGNICLCLKGVTETAAGYHWAYYEEAKTI